MSDTNNATNLDDMSPTQKRKLEKDLLLKRAAVMGLKLDPKLSVGKLKAAIKQHKESLLASEEPEDEDDIEEEETLQSAPKPRVLSAREKEAIKRRDLIAEATKLVRLRVTCLNPRKKDLPGEIFTVGNRYVGTISKYVPFGDQTENGYHVPWAIYQHMKSRTFLHIQVRNRGSQGTVVRTQDVPEFALEVLPTLTPAELRKLAQRQAMAKGAADDDDDY